MSNKTLMTLLVSIAAHIAVITALAHQKVEHHVLSVGAIQAPVSVTFSTAQQSKSAPKPVEKQVEKQPEPEAAPKPKPKTKPPVQHAKPVLKRQQKPAPKPKPKHESKKTEKKPVQPEVNKPKTDNDAPKKVDGSIKASVTKASKTPGLSNDPVIVSDPVVLSSVRPRYPRMAKRRHQQGLVMLDVLIDEQGHPIDVKVLKSSGHTSLDKAAVSAVKRWEFQPKKVNHRLVKSRAHLPVSFQLD